MKRIVSIAIVALGQTAMAASSFPGQLESGRASTIEYGNQVPSHATYPAAGHATYRAKIGAIECMERTYVLQANQLAAIPGGGAEPLKDVMRRGRCSYAKSTDKNFIVQRFESYDAPIGHADLAYSIVTFSAEEAGGTSLSIPFYIARRDITQVR